MRVILRTNVAAILKNIDGQDSIFGSLILVKSMLPQLSLSRKTFPENFAYVLNG